MIRRILSRKIQTLVLLFVYGVSFAPVGEVAFAQGGSNFAGIDADVQLAMNQLHVPGVSFGVVIDGTVVFAKGYGVREVGKPALVNTSTLFAIGSMTKSFTATAIAAMVDDGKLAWDTPVIDYLSWFQLYDPIATELITPRDLLTHRSGLPSHDFIRTSTYLTREELLRRLRYLEPSSTFRQEFQYSNLMYVVAGYLAGQASGMTWETLVKKRIFIPLAMTHSNTSARELQQADNWAHPYRYENGALVPIPVYDYQKFGIGPNGAINSCVDDMLKYLSFHLGDGTVDGQQIISATQMKELHTPVTVTPDGDYALGWDVVYHRGEKMLKHGGEINGYTSEMILLPAEKAGIVVLSNQESLLPEVIANDLRDRILHVTPGDYLGEALRVAAKSAQRLVERKSKFEGERIPNTKPSLDLAAYAGTYFHPAYGSIHVDRVGDGLIVHFDALDLTLRHYNYDTFAYETNLVQFHLNGHGKVSEMLLPLEPAVKPFVFVKEQ